VEHGLWKPASTWTAAAWVPLLGVVGSIEDFTGDLRPLLPEELGQRWDTAIAGLQQRLITGSVRSGAHISPDQPGRPVTPVILQRPFWQRYRIKGFGTSDVVILHDGAMATDIRVPNDQWRGLFLCAADLAKVYPLGPIGAGAVEAAELAAPPPKAAREAAREVKLPRKPSPKPRGRKPKFDWKVTVKNFVKRRRRSGNATTTRQALDFCQQKWSWEPDDGSMREFLKTF
jgi:hypothetical protein